MIARVDSIISNHSWNMLEPIVFVNITIKGFTLVPFFVLLLFCNIDDRSLQVHLRTNIYFYQVFRGCYTGRSRTIFHAKTDSPHFYFILAIHCLLIFLCLLL
jgi:hypothetical protein